MASRRIEEIDENGRRKTIIIEEPGEKLSRYGRLHTEMTGEVVVVRSRKDPWALSQSWLRALVLWVVAAGAIAEALLAFRLGFRLAAANPGNGFVNLMYDVSGPLVQPFEGIARNRSLDGGVFEPATLTAMAVYVVAASLLVALLWAARAAPSTGRRSEVTRTESRTRVLGHD
ncbi:MAG: hypothetical protein HYY03_00875 [Chloroflexi bacterium]|nr:hypothetical protein [Chloroflexota bacterium]